MNESRVGGGEPEPYRTVSFAAGKWWEWDESHPQEKEYEEAFEAVFQSRHDPLFAHFKFFFERFAPPIPPMQYARHYHNPDDPSGRHTFKHVVKRANSKARASWSHQQSLIVVRDELRSQVGYLDSDINALLVGVRRVLKVWLHQSLIAKSESDDRARRGEHVVRQVRDVWTAFTATGGELGIQRGFSPQESVQKAPWKDLPDEQALAVEAGLTHYLRSLKPRWRQAAYLDFKRHTLDLCIHALLMGNDLPTWEEVHPPPKDPLYVVGEALHCRYRQCEAPFTRITALTRWASSLPGIVLAGRTLQDRFVKAGMYETGGDAAKGKEDPEKMDRLQRALMGYYQEKNAEGNSA